MTPLAKTEERKNIERIYLLILSVFIIGLFISRAALSIASISFVVIAIYYKIRHSQETWLQANKHFALLYLCLFVLGGLSYFYSSNHHDYFSYMRTWLPMLGLPFAFFTLPVLSAKNFFHLLSIYVVIVLLGVLWSLGQFALDTTAIIESYERAKVMPTPLGGDHIRFSLSVVLAASVSVVLAMVTSRKKVYFSGERNMWIFISIFLFLYLHILAVKSGLLSGWMAYAWLSLFFFLRKRYALSLILTSILIVTPIFSYFCIPTFQQKLGYIKYEFAEHEKSGRVEYLSDVNRLVSYELAWQKTVANPILGVGLGDINDEIRASYHEYYPEVRRESILLPHNQWLLNGLALGFPGMLLLTMLYLYPLTIRTYRRSFMGITLSLVGLMALMVEPVLMTQYGITTYMFLQLLFFSNYTCLTNRDTKLLFACEKF